MSLNATKLQAWRGQGVSQNSDRRSILYALGVGLGQEPTDEDQLSYVFERNLRVLPTMAMVLGAPLEFLRDPEIGIDFARMLHGESGLVMHDVLPVDGHLRAEAKIDQLVDRGQDKGAACYFSNEIFDQDTGKHLATSTGCFILRGNGGFGGEDAEPRKAHPVPRRAPDLTCSLAIPAQAALIYRQSGDLNPLHIDPAIAARAGFDRPIYHGLGTFGVAGHAVLRTLCDYDATRFQRLDLRYAAPVYPGETLEFAFYHQGSGRYALTARSVGRDVIVLKNGLVEVRA
jgi:acyl dehydratase